MTGEWAWVAQADDEFSPACADRRHDDCHEDDCVCACHIDEVFVYNDPGFLEGLTEMLGGGWG